MMGTFALLRVQWFVLFIPLVPGMYYAIRRGMGGTTSQVAVGAFEAAFQIFAFLCIAALGVGLRESDLRTDYLKSARDALRHAETSYWPKLDLHPDHQFHCFISHIWGTGQDQAAILKRKLQILLPAIRVFLDVDDLADISRLELYIRQSAAVVVLLTRGYFDSKNCLREVRAALAAGKPIILVHEADAAKGGTTLAEQQAACPSDLRHALFGGDSSVVPIVVFFRLRDFQQLSLKVLAKHVLLASPNRDGLTAHSTLTFLGELTAVEWLFADPVRLYTSPANRGARAYAARVSQLENCECVADLSCATHALLLLDANTVFAPVDADRIGGGGGDGGTGSLLSHLRSALDSGRRLICLHDCQVPFSHFFDAVPRELLARGIFNDLAIPLQPPPYRDVSMALLARALGAIDAASLAGGRRPTIKVPWSMQWARAARVPTPAPVCCAPAPKPTAPTARDIEMAPAVLDSACNQPAKQPLDERAPSANQNHEHHNQPFEMWI